MPSVSVLSKGSKVRSLPVKLLIAESCYLLRDLPGAAEIVLENVGRAIFQIPFQLWRAAPLVKVVMRKYRDLPADFADACLIELAVS